MADRTLPNKWHFPRWIRIVGIIIVVLAVVIFILILTGKGDLVANLGLGIWEGLKSIWLWIVGFAGGILALFQGNKKPSIQKAKKEIKEENDQIGLELDGLRDSMNRIDEWRERERSLHERELALLERELALKEEKLLVLETKIDTLSDMTGKEFFQSLPDAKQNEIKSMMESQGSGFD